MNIDILNQLQLIFLPPLTSASWFLPFLIEIHFILKSMLINKDAEL